MTPPDCKVDAELVSVNEPQGLPRALSSLQFKATVLVVALTLCVTAAVSGYLLQTSIRLSRVQQEQELGNTAELLAKAVAPSVATGDRDSIKTLLNDVVRGDPLVFAIIADASGGELALASRPEHLEKLQRARKKRPLKTALLGVPTVELSESGTVDHLEILYPIAYRPSQQVAAGRPDQSPQLVGYLRAGMATNRWNQAMASKLDLVIGVGTITTFMAVFLGFLLIRRIVSPLDSLAAKMLEFSGGNLDVRSDVRRADEIGQLSRAFNRMADEHQQTLERLFQLNAELEDRVVQRTKQLQELASRDPLTGIYNRRHFGEMLTRHFSQAIRYEQDLSFLMIDLDDFKQINDRMGHQVGDEVLKLVASTITLELRSADVCARYGGDEFVALLPQTNAEHASALAQRVLTALRDRIASEFEDIGLSASVGVASVVSSKAACAEDLMRSADRAMYKAKRGSKGQIVGAEPSLPSPRG